MSFDPSQRAVLAGLADVLIPAGDGMPSASAAAVAGQGLDQVLAAVPSLGASLADVVARAGGREPAEIGRIDAGEDRIAEGRRGWKTSQRACRVLARLGDPLEPWWC